MWPNPQEIADLVTFPEKILKGKIHFLCTEMQYCRKTNNIAIENLKHIGKICEMKDSLCYSIPRHQKFVRQFGKILNVNDVIINIVSQREIFLYSRISF